jgi:hypothetical protein
MISRATSGTGRLVFLAWRRSRVNAVWALTFSEAISTPLACSISTRESSAVWSWLANRLVEVPGLGPKRTQMITAAWAEQQAIKEVMVFLQGIGVSTSLGVRIYKTYRDKALDSFRRIAQGSWSSWRGSEDASRGG